MPQTINHYARNADICIDVVVEGDVGTIFCGREATGGLVRTLHVCVESFCYE